VSNYQKTTEAVAKLTPNQYRVTQEDATEPAFTGEYWDNHEQGLYVDIVSGEPLFASIHKFESGSGWPSFTVPVDPDNIVEKVDRSWGMKRVEVRSKHGDSHLGHLFDDGPRDQGGLRYCINSAAMRFVPVAELESAGYGELAHLFTTDAQKAAQS
jgi:peptide-methionine (R)-S-oxide reductase